MTLEVDVILKMAMINLLNFREAWSLWEPDCHAFGGRRFHRLEEGEQLTMLGTSGLVGHSAQRRFQCARDPGGSLGRLRLT